MKEAVGLLEVYGFTAALVAVDTACKAANVTVEGFDNNKAKDAKNFTIPLMIVVKFRGSVEDIKIALDAGKKAAEKISKTGNISIISKPSDNTEKILRLNFIEKI